MLWLASEVKPLKKRCSLFMPLLANEGDWKSVPCLLTLTDFKDDSPNLIWGGKERIKFKVEMNEMGREKLREKPVKSKVSSIEKLTKLTNLKQGWSRKKRDYSNVYSQEEWGYYYGHCRNRKRLRKNSTNKYMPKSKTIHMRHIISRKGNKLLKLLKIKQSK